MKIINKNIIDEINFEFPLYYDIYDIYFNRLVDNLTKISILYNIEFEIKNLNKSTSFTFKKENIILYLNVKFENMKFNFTISNKNENYKNFVDISDLINIIKNNFEK